MTVNLTSATPPVAEPNITINRQLKPKDITPNASSDIFKRLKVSAIGSDLVLAFAVIAILVILIFPMPAFALDFLLAGSIIFSVLILMTTLFIAEPLEFSAFPVVLLIATMSRLAMNLASTRLILAFGHEGTSSAGLVIEGFGSFVMRGSFIIGIIVFAILVLVNFIVITKGSGRIAEVSARFTLDAMPGKQMAIDADLAAGLIDEQQARTRRKKIEDESSFFGAMDGASKFVRGDAIAGLMITLINIIGGILIGMITHGLTIAEASRTYIILTVGDGLVTQIPALIVSTAAGLLVSKAGVSGSTDKALVTQFTNYPKALAMSSIVMAIISILPGMPFLPFALLSAGVGYFAYSCHNKQLTAESERLQTLDQETKSEDESQQDILASALAMDGLRLELGYGLIGLVNSEIDEDRLTNQIKALRRQIASELGYLMPPVRIIDNMQLEANNYLIKIKEVEAGNGLVYPGQHMVMDPQGNEITIPGIKSHEPTFGLPAVWVGEEHHEQAAIAGLTVVDASTVIATHLTETIKNNIAELLTYADVQKLLGDLPKDQQKLIEDIVPNHITVSTIQRVLQSLLSERVSIRDLPSILEAIADIAPTIRSHQAITEHVRTRLARQISAQYCSPAGYIPLVILSPEWEKILMDSLTTQGESINLAIAPSKLQKFIKDLRNAFEQASNQGDLPVFLVSPSLRAHIRALIERIRPQTAVISQAEIHPRAQLKSLASV